MFRIVLSFVCVFWHSTSVLECKKVIFLFFHVFLFICCLLSNNAMKCLNSKDFSALVLLAEAPH